MKIIFEDNHIIVVEKQTNIPVQSDSSKDMSLLEEVKAYLKVKYNKPGNVYLGLVHRLDRPVGGVMVFAKTSKAASRLSEQIRKNEFQKIYIAIVNGKLDKEKDILENYLLKSKKTNTSAVVEDNTGKYAKLEYELIEYNAKENLSLLKIKLHTGRHHQIRVQLANIGHSIYGDQRYGRLQEKKQIALWAHQLEFTHPVTKEQIRFISKPDNIGIWAEFEIIN